MGAGLGLEDEELAEDETDDDEMKIASRGHELENSASKADVY